VQAAQENFLEERHTEELALISESIRILEEHAALVNGDIKSTLDSMAQTRASVTPAESNPLVRVLRRAAAPSAQAAAAQSRIENVRRTISDLEQFRSRRLAEMQATLADQRNVFGPEHPQIANTLQLIRSLQTDSPQLVQLRREEQELRDRLGRMGADATGASVGASADPILATAALRSLDRLRTDSLVGEKQQYSRARLRMSIHSFEEPAGADRCRADRATDDARGVQVPLRRPHAAADSDESHQAATGDPARGRARARHGAGAVRGDRTRRRDRAHPRALADRAGAWSARARRGAARVIAATVALGSGHPRRSGDRAGRAGRTVSPAALIGGALAATAVPPLLASLYLGALAVTARPAAARPRRSPRTRFDVIVPAHDEEAGIAATVASLLAVDYPRSHFRLVVIADNCGDATAECARTAGALVHERRDAEHRGKGYALAYGFERSLADGHADAVVVVDADTTVSPNLLRAFDAALGGGEQALQAHYGVRNPRASWRTRLVSLGFTLFHGVRSVARERLGLSCGLRGNGMCFGADLLRRVPHRAFSIVEDLEYGLALGLAGVRVAYVAEAHVLGDMPGTAVDARSQRERWEGGRRAVVREYARPLLRAAATRRDPVLLDLALDLVLPPLSHLAAAVGGGWTLAVAAALVGGHASLAVGSGAWQWRGWPSTWPADVR
jgi:hypothetical protein